MELDFTGLNKIAYKGFETAEEKEARDSLLQAGYTVVEPEENPFTAPQASAPEPPPADHGHSDHGSASPQDKASAGKGAPFTDHTGSRSYKKMYRIAHDFHQRHAPPTVCRDYWHDHKPGEDEAPEEELRYWTEAAADVSKITSAGDNDPFLIDLLIAVYSELEREYKALREEAAVGAEGHAKAPPEALERL